MATSSQPAGILAIQLVQQLQRNPDVIPPFNHELMKACTIRINELYQLNHNDVMAIRSGNVDSQENTSAIVQARQATINFVRRCCLAYLQERMKRIRTLRWKFGLIPVAIKHNLTEAELEFFNEYANSLAEFQTSLSETPVDITESMRPPRNLFVQVRAVQDYGEFETSKGDNIMLKRNSIHSLPSKDCEPLVRQGVLEYCN